MIDNKFNVYILKEIYTYRIVILIKVFANEIQLIDEDFILIIDPVWS